QQGRGYELDRTGQVSEPLSEADRVEGRHHRWGAGELAAARDEEHRGDRDLKHPYGDKRRAARNSSCVFGGVRERAHDVVAPCNVNTCTMHICTIWFKKKTGRGVLLP